MKFNYYVSMFFMSLTLIPCQLLHSNDSTSICESKQQCQDLNNTCKCYCSVKCGPRKKRADDAPVFVPHDPRGYHCYCKQWDLDHVNDCNQE